MLDTHKHTHTYIHTHTLSPLPDPKPCCWRPHSEVPLQGAVSSGLQLECKDPFTWKQHAATLQLK